MAKRDYYEVLGVSKSASAEEIKKTFRTRARQLHPDNKDSGDEAAFKELAEAYEVLSDQNKRAQYDRYGHQGVAGAGRGFENVDFSSFAGFGIDDIIDMFFGGGMRSGGRRGGPEQGANLKFDLEIEFLEAVFGTEKKVSIRRLEDCETCNGSGAAPGSEPMTCVTCAGMGQVQQVVNSFFGQSMRIIECPACQGSGKKIDKPCKDCKGEAQIRKQRDFELTIGAGIDNGARLRLNGAGDKGRRGGPFGDLYVVVHVRDHKQFVRDGDIIHLRQPVGFALAALGGEMMVPTVDGERVLKIPAGVQHGTKIVMKDLGVPRFNYPGRRGDQIVHISVETPARLSTEERELFQQLAKLRGESLSLTEDQRQAEAARLAEIKAKEESAEQARKTKQSSSSKSKHDKKEEVKEESSIIDKIGEFFRPKNGEHEHK
jgi:molecular chaperone DnaJ